MQIESKDSLNDGRKKINNAIKAFNETVVEGDSSVEAAQARVDAEGESHGTLKDRLDHEHNELSTKKADKSELDDKASIDALNKKADKDALNDYVSDNEFKGVLLVLDNDIPAEDMEYITPNWGSAIYNLSGFWSKSDPTKIVIPKGVKKVKLSASAIWNSNASGYRRMQMRKNNQYTPGLAYINNQAVSTSTMTASSTVVEVEEGDFFTVRYQQSSGETLTFRKDPYTWFSLEVIEYSNPK